VVGDLGAIKRAQQSGLQFGGNGGLASIPLFDMKGIYNDDGGYRYQWTQFATRDGWPKRTAVPITMSCSAPTKAATSKASGRIHDQAPSFLAG